MKKLLFIICLLFISQPAYSMVKPKIGHLTHMNHVTNYARSIEPNKDLMKAIIPEFLDVMKREPIIAKKWDHDYDTLALTNIRINRKESFALSPWMTPKEFEASEYADCKGYAIAKYYKLRALGWSKDDLNLWSGDYDGQSHMMLTARFEGKVYVLDIMDQSLPEAKDYFFKHFVPSYRFNETGLDFE